MPAEERRPAEKAAAVISILGSERASEVFRYLTENEVEQLSMEITRLPRLAEDELEDIAKDFYNCCVTEKVITEGGRDYAKEVLELSLIHISEAQQLEEKLGQSRQKEQAMEEELVRLLALKDILESDMEELKTQIQGADRDYRQAEEKRQRQYDLSLIHI